MDSILTEMYNELLLSIKCGRSINKKSIAKPALLFSIIDAISTKRLRCNQILWGDEVIEKNYYKIIKHFGGEIQTPINNPFYHLASASFYHLIWKDNKYSLYKAHTPSAKYLRENLQYAKFDEELWSLLQEEKNRQYFKNNLIKRYLCDNHNN